MDSLKLTDQQHDASAVPIERIDTPHTSKERQLSFNLTCETFYALLNASCTYCGAPASAGSLGYNGIDRVDNNRGYEPDNVVACCSVCNSAKHSMSVRDWNVYQSRMSNFPYSFEVVV